MELAPSIRIPKEIHRFFTNPGGHSLIVRGDAGTGKTTFALQLIEELGSLEDSFYHSTRVSDHSLFTQFTWLKDLPGRMEISGTCYGGQASSGPEMGRGGLSDLKGITEGPAAIPQCDCLTIAIGRDLGELDDIYRRIEQCLPAKTLTVIDSIDALADRYGLTPAKLLNTIQRDIVETYGSNVMFIVEKASPELDYLGDGVINLSRSEFSRRRIRELDILKLRGCEIQQPKYIFTLDGGRIQTFEYPRTPLAERMPQWRRIDDIEENISTGIRDLDTVLGGLAKGSITLIELGPGVPAQVGGTIENGLVSNSVAQGRGVLWTPLRKASPELSRARVGPAISDVDFARCVRIPEKVDEMGYSDAPFVMAVEGSSALSDFKWQNIEFALSDAQRPLMLVMGIDTMRSMYGSEVIEHLVEIFGQVRRNGATMVAFAPPSSGKSGRLADLATTRLKVDRIGGTVLLYGEEPFTECFSWHFEDREVGGNVSLTPIL